MKIRFDENGYVSGYVVVGDMDGAVEFAGEIPDGFNASTCQYYRLDGGVLVLDAKKQTADIDVYVAQAELDGLCAWFEDYDLQVMKWLRGQRIGIPRDDIDMIRLDTEAEQKRMRIREIKEKSYGIDK